MTALHESPTSSSSMYCGRRFGGWQALSTCVSLTPTEAHCFRVTPQLNHTPAYPRGVPQPFAKLAKGALVEGRGFIPAERRAAQWTPLACPARPDEGGENSPVASLNGRCLSRATPLCYHSLASPCQLWKFPNPERLAHPPAEVSEDTWVLRMRRASLERALEDIPPLPRLQTAPRVLTCRYRALGWSSWELQ
jgi:hypothetical protein